MTMRSEPSLCQLLLVDMIWCMDVCCSACDRIIQHPDSEMQPSLGTLIASTVCSGASVPLTRMDDYDSLEWCSVLAWAGCTRRPSEQAVDHTCCPSDTSHTAARTMSLLNLC